jgi:hypothetical protein
MAVLMFLWAYTFCEPGANVFGGAALFCGPGAYTGKFTF